MPYDRTYGPWVEVNKDMPGFRCAVLQTYRGEKRSPVIWRGKVCIRFMDQDLLDMEGTLLESKTGEGSYFAMPERSYESNGQTKYQKQVYVHRKELLGALAECVREEIGGGPLADDDVPF